MKLDLLVIRLGFVLLLALGGYELNPLARFTLFQSYIGADLDTKTLLSAGFGAIVAMMIIAFEVRAREASLKTLFGAACGSILGIIGAYLIGMLRSAQDINTVSGELKTFLTIALV